MDRASSMNVIWQLTTFFITFSTILCLAKEILLKMWKLHIFMVILLILNSKKTSGKHFYFWLIESYPLKTTHTVRVVIGCSSMEKSQFISRSSLTNMGVQQSSEWTKIFFDEILWDSCCLFLVETIFFGVNSFFEQLDVFSRKLLLYID
jgi:hypothetical protein